MHSTKKRKTERQVSLLQDIVELFLEYKTFQATNADEFPICVSRQVHFFVPIIMPVSRYLENAPSSIRCQKFALCMPGT